MTRKSTIAAMLITFLFLLGTVNLRGQTTSDSDSSGTDFWLAFPANYDSSATLSLLITGDTNTSGTVSISSLSFTSGFNVVSGQVTTVNIPVAAQIKSTDTVGSLGIHVTTQDKVTIYGLNKIPYSTDAYLGLPTAVLGNEYIVLGFPSTTPFGSEFAILGTADGTTITITPTSTVGLRTAGIPYSITLNQGQTYQLQDTTNSPTIDLSGTVITSDKPIAVYGGNVCAYVPSTGYTACNHLVEQLPPTSAWGKAFFTEPLATRIGGDTFRFLASTDNTTLSINGSVVATLNRGQVYQQILAIASVITANNPILVAQYSNSYSFDRVSADPFMMLVAPHEQHLTNYTITTPASGFSPNYVNVVAPTAGLASLTLDGAAIDATLFAQIGRSEFSGGQVPIAPGSHHLAASVPFGANIYGYADYDGYGYPGGFSLAPVASVTSVALTPKTATATASSRACVVATVKDQRSNGLRGVRADFTVTGVNATTGQATTDSSGQAEFCYTGVTTGIDTVTGSASGVSDTASITWASATTTVLTASPNPATVKKQVTFTATVSPTPTGSSSGTISFYNGSTLLGSGAVGSSGVATFVTSDLAAGSLSIRAEYSGTTGYTASSGTATLTIEDSFSIVASQTSVSASRLRSANINLSIQPLGTQFNSPVTLSASGLPTGATATFAPSVVTPGCTGASAVLTINFRRQIAGVATTGHGQSLAFFGLTFGIFGVVLRRVSGKAILRVGAVVVLAILMILTVSCGGGSSSGTHVQPGRYVITITGTSASLSSSTDVTVVVQ